MGAAYVGVEGVGEVMTIAEQIAAIRAKVDLGIMPPPKQGPLHGREYQAPRPAYAPHSQHATSSKASQEMRQRAADQIERLGELPDDELVTTHFLVAYFGVTSGTIGKRIARGTLPRSTHFMPMAGRSAANAWRWGDLRQALGR